MERRGLCLKLALGGAYAVFRVLERRIASLGGPGGTTSLAPYAFCDRLL